MDEVDPKKRQLIDAALATVSRYGFKKSSMQDVADAAGVSRAALYLHFSSKEDIFRSAVAQLQADAYAAARAAFFADAPFTDRLRDGLVAHMRCILSVIHASPHAQEIWDAHMALAADIKEQSKARFLALLAEMIEDAAAKGEIALGTAAAATPRTLAEMIFAGVIGIKFLGGGIEDFEARTALLAQTTGAALQKSPSRQGRG